MWCDECDEWAGQAEGDECGRRRRRALWPKLETSGGPNRAESDESGPDRVGRAHLLPRRGSERHLRQIALSEPGEIRENSAGPGENQGCVNLEKFRRPGVTATATALARPDNNNNKPGSASGSTTGREQTEAVTWGGASWPWTGPGPCNQATGGRGGTPPRR